MISQRGTCFARSRRTRKERPWLKETCHATTTGWNFRAERIGNPTTIYALLGSYLPLARTRAEREARHDPRPSIEERYKGRDDYLEKIRAAATALVKERFILEQDVEDVVQRAAKHWEFATRTTHTN